MEQLYRRVGVTDETIERAREHMAHALGAKLEVYVDDAARRTVALAGYESIPIERVRPNTERAWARIFDILCGAPFDGFGEILYEVAYRRAKEGIMPRALYALIDLTEVMLAELGASCLDSEIAVFSGLIIARRIADGARQVLLDAFQKAHSEALSESIRLAKQFSAPVLPALPGVLLMPIVGAVSEARAEQIIDAMLGAIMAQKAHTVLVDLTGITDVDSSLPGHLERAVAASRLLGARVGLVGIKPDVARALVASDARLSGATLHAALAAGLLASSPAAGRVFGKSQ